MRKTHASKWVLLILSLSSAAPLLAIRGVGAAATITDLFAFPSADGSDPQFLMQASDSNLYGTTYRNGGSVFGITPAGSFSLLHKFVSDPVSGQYLNGEFPTSLAEGADGFLYGIATSGGPLIGLPVSSPGNIFKVSKTGSGFEIVHSFCSAPNCGDGAHPGSLILGSDGNFYGSTSAGGSFQGTACQYLGCGVIFRLSPGGTYTVLYAPSSGQTAAGVALQATDGNFYSLCEADSGGHPGVCRMTTSGQVSTIFTFPSTAWPRSLSTQGSDGLLYGTVTVGNNAQAIFQLSTSGTNFAQLLETPIQCCVKESFSRVIQASDGNLWVTNPNAQLFGTVYSETPSGTLLQTVPFGGKTNGSAPTFLIQGSSGQLYGTTYGGGSTGAGTVFSINAGLPPK
jgi:uncharacterized repeat protein (TIGR03803 family)